MISNSLVSLNCSLDNLLTSLALIMALSTTSYSIFLLIREILTHRKNKRHRTARYLNSLRLTKLPNEPVFYDYDFFDSFDVKSDISEWKDMIEYRATFFDE